MRKRNSDRKEKEMLPIIILAAVLITVVLMLVLSDRAVRRRKDMKGWQKDHFKFDALCRTAKESINDVLNLDFDEMYSLSKEERIKRERQQSRLRRATREACSGDSGDRDFLKDYIKDLLQKQLGIDKVTINQVIPFSNPDAMTAVEKYEYMYTMYRSRYHFRVFSYMEKDFGWLIQKDRGNGTFIYEINEDDINRAYEECRFTGDFDDQLETLVQRVFETLYGNDVADLMIIDESFDGVSGGVGGITRANYNYIDELSRLHDRYAMPSRPYETIYCVYHGRTIRLKFLSFRSEDVLKSVVKKVYSYDVKTVLSKLHPVLHGTMKNNSRVVVARPPVSDSWVFYIRKFESADARDITTLVTHPGRGIVIEMLRTITQGEVNFVVSGEMGSGKTTMIKALVGFMNPLYTIRTAETSFELSLNNMYPERNIHAMQESTGGQNEVSIYDILTATKKMDSDIVVIGEVNAPKIAYAFVQVAQSGSKAALTTLHHRSTSAMIEYFTNVLVGELGVSEKIAEKEIVGILNFDVHTKKDLEGNFYIERITEVIPDESGAYPLNADEARREFYRRQTDRHSYRLNNIIVFDRDIMGYRAVNNISEYTYELLAMKLGTEMTDRIVAELNSAIAGESLDCLYEKEEAPSGSGTADGYGDDEYGNEYDDIPLRN